MFDLNICRLCRSDDNLVDLNENYMDNNFYHLIYVCLDLMINSEDGLPTFICRRCKNKIKKFYRFKQKCIKTESQLRQLREKSEKIIENVNYTKVYPHSEDHNINYHHMQVENGNEIAFEDSNEHTSIQCELCGSMFSSNIQYRKHLSSHGETRLYQCKFCPKRFTRAESNKIHMRSHLGIKPFICELCGQSSTKKQDLMRHMKIHADERNHECLTCGRRFKRSSDLGSHVRTHTGARPYKCSVCEKDYTSHSGLRKHYRSHSDINLK